jgi:phosphoglycerate dehydrogenase-like enzyme
MTDHQPPDHLPAGRKPVILNHLGPRVGKRLAAHWSQPTVIERDPSAAPWIIPDDIDVLVTRPLEVGWDKAPAEAPPGWPHGLKWIQTASAGVDNYPSWVLGGPPVTCGRGVAAVPIAEFTLAAMLALVKRIEGIRVRSPVDWQLRHHLSGLHGQTIGLVGYGAIGREIAVRASAFGMKVGVMRRTPWTKPEQGIRTFSSIGDLAAVSDHLVLALPLTPETRHIVNAAVFDRAKPGLHLINIARGGLVDQEALLRALDKGQVGWATLDVTEPEPLPKRHPFYDHPCVWLSPHVSWSDTGSEERLTVKILGNLDAYVRGLPLTDVVDVAAGY